MELYHHGMLGQKWGKRNGPPYPLSNNTLSTSSPKKVLSNGDSIYKKGTIIGRYGSFNHKDPTYFFTNQEDRDVYSDHIGGKEYRFRLKKSIKIPSEVKQIEELYNFTKDEEVLRDPYYYWKDNINQGGKLADRYFKYMKNKGYDGLVDTRNSGGISEDPILIFNPRTCMREIKIQNDKEVHTHD